MPSSAMPGRSHPKTGCRGTVSRAWSRRAACSSAAAASGRRAGLLQGAQVALASGVPAVATQRLQTWVVSHPRDAQAWQLLAQLTRNHIRSRTRGKRNHDPEIVRGKSVAGVGGMNSVCNNDHCKRTDLNSGFQARGVACVVSAISHRVFPS